MQTSLVATPHDPKPLAHQRQVLCGIAALTAVLLILPLSWMAYVCFALVLLVFLIYVTVSTLEGKVETFLLAWMLISPLGYYYLSFPQDKPLLSLDRGLVVLLGVAMCFASASDTTPMPRALRRVGMVWGVFLLAASLSLLKISDNSGLLSGARVLLDAFMLPALLAWYVIRCFPVRRYLRTTHVLVCLTALYLAPMGLIEFVSGQDILPLPSAGLYFAGSGENVFLRSNGPYSSSNSYSLIGLMMFCLLLFLRRALGPHALPWWQRVLHGLGLISTLIISVLSLHRSIFLTLLLMIFLEIWFTPTVRQRLAYASILLVIGGVFVAGAALVPELFEERVSSGANLYARMAQQRQTFEVFQHNPVMGAGLNNFIKSAPQGTPYTGFYSGVEPLDAPHNNLGAILAETGILGFLPYVIANGMLVAVFWQVRSSGVHDSKMIWKFFLFVFLSYWIPGLDVTSGHYGDLNLWYLLTLAFLYKYNVIEGNEGAREIPYQPVLSESSL